MLNFTPTYTYKNAFCLTTTFVCPNTKFVILSLLFYPFVFSFVLSILFFFFFNVLDSGIPFFHQFIVNNYNISKNCYKCYNYREVHVTINFSRSFCLLSVFLVRCLVDRGFSWRSLTLSVLFRLTASSHPGFLLSPFLSNALSSGAIDQPSSACFLVPPFGIFSSKLLTSRKIR